MKKKLTPHQKIVWAARRGTGCRLTAEDCWVLGVMDDAIVTRAVSDDMGESIPPPSPDQIGDKQP
ncbi:MAG TPA: hypothetical protein VHN11_04960 [Xanthobacteraceae bacterium]|nr:hypothetical protein [Xanthobacteraceae bacterium]